MLEFVLLESSTNLVNGANSFTIIITSILTLIGSLGIPYIVNVMSKRATNDKDIKIAELNSEKEKDKLVQIQKELEELHELYDNSIEELSIEKDQRVLLENKFEAVKIAFRIIFNQYEKLFKDDVDQLGMLEELKQIIEK